MSAPMKPGDKAYWMLLDEVTTEPVVHRPGCCICDDPEFAQMGLPLCRLCPQCVGREVGTGHIPADESSCDDCGYDDSQPPPPRPLDGSGYTSGGKASGRDFTVAIENVIARIRKAHGLND